MELERFSKLIGDEGNLLDEFLSFPTCSHPLDWERFVKYAIVSIIHGKNFEESCQKALHDKGVSNNEIDKLSNAYSWIEVVVKVLRKIEA